MFGYGVGLPIVTCLLFFFVGILGYGMSQGLNVDCGCFGPEETASQNSLAHAFYRDLVLLAGVLFLYVVKMIRVKSHEFEDKQSTA